ncbi:hypothetical protein [Deinococcus radiotolerans]|uniref:Uncharacterized protein n=1 Tax=Deinococcus radiotolerans TaxID=1309407 RepID=A0ABQ2FQK7_9DEIO|nr:hypothetical protein [Deinococcus radiotolerans]GGL16932.1 hypothetical protein GCM10010844_39800 [Deinococcus radiotolerans]
MALRRGGLAAYISGADQRNAVRPSTSPAPPPENAGTQPSRTPRARPGASRWSAWRDDLITDGRSVDDAEYWLDVAFVQPCPEDWPTED